MAAAAAPFVLGATSIFRGLSQRAGLRSQANAREFQAKASDLRAAQIAADRREELSRALASIEVIRAHRNVDPDSPTAQVIEEQTRRDSLEAEGREVLGERFRGVGLRTEAASLRSAGTAALVGGVGGGLSGFFTGIDRLPGRSKKGA